jgi:Family of unknown function (DUF6340)
MKNLATVLLLSVVICSCSSTNYMSLSVKRAAPVTIPAHIKNVGVVNRSNPTKATKGLDAMDKIFSAEGVNLDKEGSASSLSALILELKRNDRFTEVKTLVRPDLGNNVPSTYPAPLSWDVVDSICKQNELDAIFALELFDTDSRITYAAQPVKVNTPLGKIPAVNQQATMQTMVKTGWRIYDSKGKYILDEFAVASQLQFRGSGINPVMAANALISRKDAVKEVGAKAGEAYAYRVLPYWLRVSRKYYVRGSENFRIARRKAQTRNWDEAGKLWYEETSNSKRKIAGRACYNMAIISEINGDLDESIKWAQKAYEEHRIKLALHYVRILENRKINESILKEQEEMEAISGTTPKQTN